MNASSSALFKLIPDFINSLNISSFIAGALGYLLGVLTKFLDGYIKKYFVEIGRRDKHRRDVARQILKICIERSANNYKKAPRDMEHVFSVLTDLEGINKSMEEEMNQFMTSWQLCARDRKRGDLRPEEVEFIKKNLDIVEEKRRIMTKWANKIRSGK